MRDNDGRKLSKAVREQLRITAVQRVQAGESPEDVIKSIGFQRTCIYRWLAKFRSGGYEALKDNPNHGGRPPILTWVQMFHLYKIIATTPPEQYQCEFALWTVEMVREVIRREFKVKMSPVSVWRTLRALGLTSQKPKRVAYQQNPAAVKKWLHEEYPAIKKRAEERGARIYWGDEASVRSDYHSGTTWAKRGETPVVKTTGARYRVNMFSAVCGNGKIRFMVTEKACNAEVFIAFLKRLMCGQKEPVVLVVDGHAAHKSKRVKQYVASTDGKLSLYYLPGYSPELNPEELVWSQVKHHVVGKQTVTGADQFKQLVDHALRSLSHQVQKIANFFKKPALQYIGACT
jgi:transposase